MNEYFIIGIILLIIGSLYGYWSFFLKEKPEKSSVFSKRKDVEDKMLPFVFIITGLIMVLKNI